MMAAITIVVGMDIFTGEDMITDSILTEDISEKPVIARENTMTGDITVEKNTADAKYYFI